jgi:7-carboxy-7-deazaguanine synthase
MSRPSSPPESAPTWETSNEAGQKTAGGNSSDAPKDEDRVAVAVGSGIGALGGAALGIGAGLAWIEIFKTPDLEGYSGVLTTKKLEGEVSLVPSISLVRDIDHLRTNDIIAIEPTNGFIRTLYRPDSQDNVIFTTERCNSNCLMCSQPPRDVDDGWIIDEIRECLALLPPETSTVGFTGGEPLLQKESLLLMKALCDDGFTVLLETSGALDISPVDPRVRRIMDLKCPSSGEVARNRWENIQHLKSTDEIKFVIGTHEDYAWAKEQIAAHHLETICPLLFSWVSPLTTQQQDKTLKTAPAGQTPLSRLELAERIIADALPVRFQIQMHKIIWPAAQRGV